MIDQPKLEAGRKFDASRKGPVMDIFQVAKRLVLKYVPIQQTADAGIEIESALKDSYIEGYAAGMKDQLALNAVNEKERAALASSRRETTLAKRCAYPDCGLPRDMHGIRTMNHVFQPPDPSLPARESQAVGREALDAQTIEAWLTKWLNSRTKEQELAPDEEMQMLTDFSRTFGRNAALDVIAQHWPTIGYCFSLYRLNCSCGWSGSGSWKHVDQEQFKAEWAAHIRALKTLDAEGRR